MNNSIQAKTNCSACAFAKWGEKGGIHIQYECRVKQLDKYKELKEKVDPNGLALDNALFKLSEQGNITCYVLNMLCPFHRSKEWVDTNVTEEAFNKPEELRALVYKHIPFLYHAVIVSDGGVRGTMKSVKSVMNGTVTPQSLTVVIPAKFKNDKELIENTILAMRDRIGKDINCPHDCFSWQVRPMVNEDADCRKLQVEESIRNAAGSFYILVLNEGSKIHESFIESIKFQGIENFVDWHIISLSQDEALIVHPVLDGTCSLHPGATFVYKGTGELVQEFNLDNIRAFFNVVDDVKRS